MRKELIAYRKQIDAIIANPDDGYYAGIVEDHLNRIAFFQYERLVHLIVTLAIAILEVVAMLGAAVTGSIGFIALAVLLLVLLIPYIVHYYFLENETQKLYPQYEKLREIERSRL